MNNIEISEKLVTTPDLRYKPLALKIVKKGEKIPEGFKALEKTCA